MNKFDQASSGGHQMSLGGWGQGWEVPCPGGGRVILQGGPMSKGGLYSEVQYIMGNGHMGLPCGQND